VTEPHPTPIATLTYPWCSLTYLPFPSTGSSRLTTEPLDFREMRVTETPNPIVPWPAQTRAVPAPSGCDGEDVPGGDRTLHMDWALVAAPSLPQPTCIHTAAGTPSGLGFSPTLPFLFIS